MAPEQHQARINRLRNGDLSFGCKGRHAGLGTEECPRRLHHHHDIFCPPPTRDELVAAGIEPNGFRAASRG